MFTILDYSSALEYSIIRRYTNIVYYYYIGEMKFDVFQGNPPMVLIQPTYYNGRNMKCAVCDPIITIGGNE